MFDAGQELQVGGHYRDGRLKGRPVPYKPMGNKVNLDNPNAAEVRLVQNTNRQFAMSFVEGNSDLNETRGLFHDFFQPNLLDKIRLKKTKRKELPFFILNDAQAFESDEVLEFRARVRVPATISVWFDCHFQKAKGGHVRLAVRRERETLTFSVEEKNESLGVTFRLPGNLKELYSKPSKKRTNRFPILIGMQALRPVNGSAVEVFYAVRRLEATDRLKITEEYVRKDDRLFLVSDVFSVNYDNNPAENGSVSRGSSHANDQECIFCFHDKVNCLMTPCRHMSLCFECSKKLQSTTNKCPICRETIREIVRIEPTTPKLKNRA